MTTEQTLIILALVLAILIPIVLIRWILRVNTIVKHLETISRSLVSIQYHAAKRNSIDQDGEM